VKLTRRTFFATPLALVAQGTLDRRAIVSRHNPTLRGFDPRSPLTVGNGELCFTADCTGLQTFPKLYEKDLTLSTMSQRGWETSPNRPPGELKYTEYDTYGRMVGYPTSSTGQVALFNWLRENPHRASLGSIGFAIERPEDVHVIQQTLDLWTGILHSEFEWQGKRVKVETGCHPTQNAIAFRVQGADIPIAKTGQVTVLDPDSTFKASADHWQRYWAGGAAIDLSASPELERRVVLSQYLTAIQCAGSLPPQETGLTCNSWFGKFHLEMHLTG
jgi:hypothetical protein